VAYVVLIRCDEESYLNLLLTDKLEDNILI
jgi:hypothetical protein